MNETEQDRLEDIFFLEAPYDYVLTFSNKRPKNVLGSCFLGPKIIEVYHKNSYFDCLWTILHELAHANMSNVTEKHSDIWEKEFVRLLTKYKFPQNEIPTDILGPNLREWLHV